MSLDSSFYAAEKSMSSVRSTFGEQQGSEFWQGMRDFLLFMVEQGVCGAEAVGFARIPDSAEEAVDLVVRSLPSALKNRLHPIEARVV